MSAAKVQAQLDELVNGRTGGYGAVPEPDRRAPGLPGRGYDHGGKSFADADFSLITDEAVQAIVNDVRADDGQRVPGAGDQGTELWNAGITSEAMNTTRPA